MRIAPLFLAATLALPALVGCRSPAPEAPASEAAPLDATSPAPGAPGAAVREGSGATPRVMKRIRRPTWKGRFRADAEGGKVAAFEGAASLGAKRVVLFSRGFVVTFFDDVKKAPSTRTLQLGDGEGRIRAHLIGTPKTLGAVNYIATDGTYTVTEATADRIVGTFEGTFVEKREGKQTVRVRGSFEYRLVQPGDAGAEGSDDAGDGSDDHDDQAGHEGHDHGGHEGHDHGDGHRH